MVAHHAECAFVATLVSTGIDTVRVLLRICAEYLEACIERQWQSVVLVLEQCDGISGDFPRNFCMVPLNIDELVDNARWGDESARIKGTFGVLSVGVEIRARIVLVLSHLKVCSQDASDSVVQAVDWDRAI